jgi:hypothetical protein
LREKTITLTGDDAEFMYNQLLARKYVFQEQLKNWDSINNTSEVKRCNNAIIRIDNLLNQILNG